MKLNTNIEAGALRKIAFAVVLLCCSYGGSATLAQPSLSIPLPSCEILDGEPCTHAQQKTCSKGSGVTGTCYCTRHVDPEWGTYWEWACN